MKKILPLLWKLSLYALAIFVIWGFFYFEPSTILRVFVILLVVIGLASIRMMPEIFIVVLLYLALYDLYNVLYGLAIPLALVIIVVFFLTVFLFFWQSSFSKIDKNLDKNIFRLYQMTTGLVILEIFLVMYLWPVEPKLKGLVISVVFYLLLRLFYLYANRVLNLKRALPLVIVTLVILATVLAANMWLGY